MPTAKLYDVLLVLCALVSTNALAATADFQFIASNNPDEHDVYVSISPESGDTLGIAGFHFEVTGIPANQISWLPAPLFGYDQSQDLVLGFTTQLHSIVGDPATSTLYAVAASQSQDPETHVHGVGMVSISIPTLPQPLEFGVPARLGTIKAPQLNANNIANLQLSLFPTTGSQPVAPTSIYYSFPIIEGGFTTIPGFGSTLDFGSGPEARTLQLETFDGGPFGAKVLGAEIMGEDASLFSVTPFAPYDFVGNERFNIDVHFNGTTMPGEYSAQLALTWGESGGTQTTFYPLVARVDNGAPIPEPHTLLLATLGLLALAGATRCR